MSVFGSLEKKKIQINHVIERCEINENAWKKHFLQSHWPFQTTTQKNIYMTRKNNSQFDKVELESVKKDEIIELLKRVKWLRWWYFIGKTEKIKKAEKKRFEMKNKKRIYERIEKDYFNCHRNGEERT